MSMEIPPAPSAGLIEIDEVEVVLALVLVDVSVLVPVVVTSLAVLVSLAVVLSLEDWVEVWEATEVVCSDVDAEADVEESSNQISVV